MKTIWFKSGVEGAEVAPGFAVPPYSVKSVPLGHYVENAYGFNVLQFAEAPGVKFTDAASAQVLCERWNA